jgi:hypothetical protein
MPRPCCGFGNPGTLCEMPKNRLRVGFGGMVMASRRIQDRCAPRYWPFPLAAGVSSAAVVVPGGFVGGNGITEGGFSASLVPGPRLR